MKPSRPQNNFPARLDTGAHYNRQFMPQVHGAPEAFTYGMPPEQVHAAQGSSPMSDLLRVLKKRYWVILSIVAAVFGFSFLYCVFAPHEYRAKTILEIRGYNPVLQVAESEGVMQQDTRKEAYQRTTTAKLKQLGLANEALAQKNLAMDLQRYFKSKKTATRNFFDYMYSLLEEEDEYVEVVDVENPKKRNRDKQYDFPEEFLKSYLGLIDINPVSDTSLVEIVVTTTSPSLSQRIANAHADVFIDHLSRERQSQLRTNLAVLEEHARGLKNELARAESKLGKYAKDHKLVALSLTSDVSGNSRDENLVVKGISELTSLLAVAKSARIESQARLEEFRRSKQSGRTTEDDKLIQALRLQLKQKKASYDALSSKVTPLYPPLKELGAEIQSLERSLKDEQGIKLSALEAQYESDLSRERKLAEELERERDKANNVSSELVQYNLLSREVESLRELMDSVLKEEMQTRIAASSTKSNIFVSDYAPLPRKASAPKKKIILIFGSIIGLIIGLCVAFLIEAFNNKIETTEEAEESLGIPILGAIHSFEDFKDELPDYDHQLPAWKKQVNTALEFVQKTLEDEDSADELDTLLSESKNKGEEGQNASSKKKKKSKKKKGKKEVLRTNKNKQPEPDKVVSVVGSNPMVGTEFENAEIVSLTSPNAAVSEALRTIRASILFSSPDAPPKVILVTSSNKGEGKTTVACNLAVTLAQASYKTLLIDADLRNPSCAKKFGISSTKPGLVDFLTGHVGAQEAFDSTGIPGLFLLLSGSSTPNPAELVGSRKMSDLLDALRSEFDYIIVDSAPVLPVADTLTLASITDAVSFVVRSGTSERSAAKEAVGRLQRVGAHILGTIVNDLELRFSEYSVQSYYPNTTEVVDVGGDDGVRKRA